ncbi:MAG: hypothetical protein ACPG46_08140 [Thalassotalea sp.]
MFTINKKLGSFVFGCALAASYLWLVSVGSSISVFDMLLVNTGLALDHYSGIVTAVLALVVSGSLLLIMNKGFNLCPSEHPFWLLLPSLYLLTLTTFSAFEMLVSILYAAVPCLFVFGVSAVFFRISRQKLWLKTED